MSDYKLLGIIYNEIKRSHFASDVTSCITEYVNARYVIVSCLRLCQSSFLVDRSIAHDYFSVDVSTHASKRECSLLSELDKKII